MNPFEHHYTDIAEILGRLRTIHAPNELYGRLDAKFLPPEPAYVRFFPAVRIATVCLFFVFLYAIAMAHPGNPLYAIKIAGMHAASTITSFFSAKTNTMPAAEPQATPTPTPLPVRPLQSTDSAAQKTAKPTHTTTPTKGKTAPTVRSVVPTIVHAVPTITVVPNNPGVLEPTSTPQPALQVQTQIHIQATPTPRPEQAKEEEKPLDVSIKIGNTEIIDISL